MSAKRDILKEIDTRAKRKKELAREISQEKDVVRLVADFFSEIEKVRHLATAGLLSSLIEHSLANQVRRIDAGSKLRTVYDADHNVRVEIHWSEQYAQKNGCDRVMVLDAATALFQDAMNQLL